ncbi:malonyl-ACP O-methyltransferase BioC [Vibrio sp. SM6]|uniref:Malonyl-[acyl-carrier protein] O-methyltransferase n=1 Tax=Vibrio agarilyticus TaxID=2726741 RepID=A0A7X8TMU3_9VIBR|nr:malonyl-ACP O-methyltransferase BioC [Vibrio agarilyticus]NLS11464.1 malonyl-ACP O-methyltransferase BioC [Vibrio agarilyticus]
MERLNNTALPLESPRFNDTKAAIAQAFGRAAKHYDQHAAFQRQVGHLLLDELPHDLSGWRILDLGCGTGYFSEQLALRGAQVVCADLSTAMLEQARLRCGVGTAEFCLADAEHLPFADNSFDAVFSSLALQWCDDLSSPLAEISRVTRAGGVALFSTLLAGSLHELQAAWHKVDVHQHVNQFIALKQVNLALAQISASQHHLNLTAITVWYESALALMRDLKGIGATHVMGRAQGLTSRKTLNQVELAYQTYRNRDGLLPATYQVCLGKLKL